MTLQIAKLDRKRLIDTIFGIDSAKSFGEISMAVFHYQYTNCLPYRQFCDYLGRTPVNVNTVEDIPFMPVDFFRNHIVNCFNPAKQELIFESSTTTGSVPAKHFVADAAVYDESIKRCFKKFYGEVTGFCILALLPGYIERGNSSLVHMVKKMMEWSAHPLNGFYLNEYDKLQKVLKKLKSRGEKVLLIGVSHALLDFAESYPVNLNDVIVMETGGMKGRRKEMVRSELHNSLIRAFGVKHIHSEYGMTELLSQAYSLKDGIFKTPAWLKVIIKQINDPFATLKHGQTGVINVIDLANVFSCSFVATHDLGKKKDDNSFEVLGRLDNSEIRGCNLMAG